MLRLCHRAPFAAAATQTPSLLFQRSSWYLSHNNSNNVNTANQEMPTFSKSSLLLNFQKANYQKNKKQKKKEFEAYVKSENLDVQSIALNRLAPLPGSKRGKKVLGRGPGSGKGKTAGRGMNGQKKRSSVDIPNLFEGGQSPLYRRVPKYGFSNRTFELRYKKVTLEKLQYMIDTGRINPEEGTITIKTLREAGIINGVKWPGVKLLANGKEHFQAKLDIEVQRASKEAIASIEKNGGTIRCIYLGKRAMHKIFHPERYDGVLRVQNVMPAPPPKLYKYYMREDTRGYLSLPEYVNPLREVVPDEEEGVTREKGQAYIGSYLKKVSGSGGKKKQKSSKV